VAGLHSLSLFRDELKFLRDLYGDIGDALTAF
jgi:hypothetical protein